MEGLNNFKKELKNQAINFASVYHVIKSGAGKSGAGDRDEKVEGAYSKLEKFVLERFNTWIIESPSKVEIEEPVVAPVVHPEDTTLQLDF